MYDGDNAVLRIVGVEHMYWQDGEYEVEAHEYSVLAFRIKGTAAIESGAKEYFVNTNEILYLPQNMSYTARYTDTEIIVIHFITQRDDSYIKTFAFIVVKRYINCF